MSSSNGVRKRTQQCAAAMRLWHEGQLSIHLRREGEREGDGERGGRGEDREKERGSCKKREERGRERV